MERRHLAFRDYLRDHVDTAEQYASLKRDLAKANGLNCSEARLRYTVAKGPFIESVIECAIAAGYPKSNGAGRLTRATCGSTPSALGHEAAVQ